MTEKKTGVWLIGGLGSIASTVIVGTLALQEGLADATGMITAAEPFQSLDLVPLNALTFGGCDVRQGSLVESARAMTKLTGCLDAASLRAMEDELNTVQARIGKGTMRNCGDAIERLATCALDGELSLRDEVSRIREQLETFRDENNLHHVVVVNLASTEPHLNLQECHATLDGFEAGLDRNDVTILKASSMYAYAAIDAGCAYVNFTPSSGALFPALVQMAEERSVPVMGNDGKTGETLVKSALAPMFACRNLQVMSWEGFNILGNLDGRVLDHPDNRESKIKTKDSVLGKILGYDLHSRVHIDYVPSLDDQKTAWDFIHFKGFLGARMSLQFVWQGYDSLLAAPLVLDLVRFAELARRKGEGGLMTHLASYFKAPLGVEEYRLYKQYEMLEDYARKHGSER